MERQWPSGQLPLASVAGKTRDRAAIIIRDWQSVGASRRVTVVVPHVVLSTSTRSAVFRRQLAARAFGKTLGEGHSR